jgi:hypothetical protein
MFSTYGYVCKKEKGNEKEKKCYFFYHVNTLVGICGVIIEVYLFEEGNAMV